MEKSIEELATLFMDLQNLLQVQQIQLNTIETHVDTTAQQIEEGGTEIKRAISIRKKSRKKLWCIVVLVLILVLGVGIVGYLQACTWFRINCPK
jgi:syntaxin 1B/2/3